MSNVNQSNLIHKAKTSPRGHAKAGHWEAHRDNTGHVNVVHWHTLMFRVCLTTDEVIPISRGWGSISDKQGVGKILRGYGLNLSYKDVYEGAKV